MPDSVNLLETIDLVKRYGNRTVVNRVGYTVRHGEIVGLLGRNGAGKTTSFRITIGMIVPNAGRVTIDGCNPFDLAERELANFRNQQVGFVFQDHHLLPQCSVLENVLLPTLAAPGHQDASERGRELLDRVGLTERLDHRPAELSGGERQRVAVARALVNSPVLLLADEPTGNLDRSTAESIAVLLSEIHRDQNVTLVVVTHSESLAGRFGRRFDVVDGTLVAQGGA